MNDLYKEFEVFCSTHSCSNCKYKDVEHCHFYWSVDKARADERESILEWCKEQSRILKSQADDYDSEECFGGYRAFEDVIRHLEIVRGGENERNTD